MEINLSRFGVSNIYNKYIYLVYMHLSYATVHFILTRQVLLNKDANYFCGFRESSFNTGGGLKFLSTLERGRDEGFFRPQYFFTYYAKYRLF